MNEFDHSLSRLARGEFNNAQQMMREIAEGNLPDPNDFAHQVRALADNMITLTKHDPSGPWPELRKILFNLCLAMAESCQKDATNK